MENARVKKLKAFEFLCENRLGVLSTISSTENVPEGSLIYYVVEQKFVYFIVSRQSRKLTNIKNRNKVALTVFTESPPLEIQIEGIAEAIYDSDKVDYIAKFYMEKVHKDPGILNWPPLLKLPNSEGFEFVRLTVNWFKFSDFSEHEANIVEGTAEDWH